MIIIKLHKINPKFQNIYYNYQKILEEYESLLNFGYLECPYCKQSNYIKWGFYERNIIFIYNSEIQSKLLKVQRISCKNCGHTHALLPDGIIPYKQHSLKIVIDSILNRNLNKLYLSDNLIKKWKRQYKNIFHLRIRTTFPKKVPYPLDDMIEFEEDRIEFLDQNNLYFLQIKRTVISYAPS